MMSYERANVLMQYLDELRVLNDSGYHCAFEIKDVMNNIGLELGLSEFQTGSVNFGHHIEHHPLIEWDDTRKQPVIANSSVDNGTHGRPNVTVQEILQKLALGKTIHQLCGEYDLDINQVCGAVTFASYVVSDGVYSDD